MTEEESLEQQTEATPGAVQSAAQPAEKKPAPLIIMGVVLLLLLLVAGGVLYILLSRGGNQELMSAASPEEKIYFAEYLKRKQTEDALFYTRDEDPIFTRQFNYTVNLSDKKHILKISWKAMMFDDMAVAYLMERKLVIDDSIAAMLSRWTKDKLKTRSGLVLLKRDIYKELNSVFEQSYIEQSETKDRNPVKGILVTDFYIH